jgi:DNA-binding NtrC family response regulator
VRHLVERALEKRSLSAEVTTLRRIVDSADLGIIGNSPKIIALRQLIRHISRGEANVLVTGKSGTGKELVASAIHKLSARAARRFLAVNCASFTEELLANELFGHEAGAFTGANRAKAGLLEAADGGTVFFDEVGDMSLAMQAKLLRAIQERQLLRVGGSTPISIDIRIIAATNKDLKKAMHIGSFREDLYFRLNVVPVQLPTLAERRDDIPLLARHFLDRFNETAPRPIAGFSDPAMKVLTSYDYPGNVRELENLVARSASLARGEMIEVRDLPEDLLELETFTFEEPATQFKSLAEIELEYIRWVLARCDNNKSRAAEILGINRVSLYRKLRKSQLQED